MSGSTIGIKIADGTYYPILERDSQKKKKLVLTTAKDLQTSVQIDLYEGDGEEIDNARYVGSLLIEDIEAGAQGESEIELQVGLDVGGNLTAQAEDLGTGESQSLNVSLETFGEEGAYDIPEFELDDEFDPWTATAVEEGDDTLGEVPTAYEEDLSLDQEEEKRPVRRPIMLAVFIVLGVAAIAAIAILLYRALEGPPIPPLEAASDNQVETVDASSKAQTDPPAETDTGSANAPGTPDAAAPGAEARDGPAEQSIDSSPDQADLAAADIQIPSDADIGGVWYWIRWGDTLWDISSSFYRNPWLYGNIAEQNSIKNPDIIYAGAKIYIPEP